MSSAALLIGIVVIALLVVLPVAFLVSLVLLFVTKNKAWLFAVIPSGVLAALLFALMAAGLVMRSKTVKQNISAERVPADRVVTSTDGLVQMKLPLHWRILKNLNEEAQLQAGNLVREEYLAVINELKEDFSGTLEEYADIVAGNLKDNLADGSLSGPEKVVVNGLDGLQYKLKGSIENVNISYLLTALESSRGFHQVNEWTLQSKEEKAFPVFQEVLQSFTPLVPAEEPAKEN